MAEIEYDSSGIPNSSFQVVVVEISNLLLLYANLMF